MRAVFILAMLISSPIMAAEPCPGSGRGKLLLHGGGDSPETYTVNGLELCGGKEAKVVIIPYAGGKPDFGNVKGFTDRWTDAGARNVTVLNIEDEARASYLIANADYIFFDGDAQDELVRWMNRAPNIMIAIRERHAAGALVGGMSAGAAAMSKYMIVGRTPTIEMRNYTDPKTGQTKVLVLPPKPAPELTRMSAQSTQVYEGLAFWPEAITDQHFVTRQRWARLISAVIDNPSFPGVAIDEATAIIVDQKKGEFEVVGQGTVTVIDARHAKIEKADRGSNLSASDLKLSILRAGDRFDWRHGRKIDWPL